MIQNIQTEWKTIGLYSSSDPLSTDDNTCETFDSIDDEEDELHSQMWHDTVDGIVCIDTNSPLLLQGLGEDNNYSASSICRIRLLARPCWVVEKAIFLKQAIWIQLL